MFRRCDAILWVCMCVRCAYTYSRTCGWAKWQHTSWLFHAVFAKYLLRSRKNAPAERRMGVSVHKHIIPFHAHKAHTKTVFVTFNGFSNLLVFMPGKTNVQWLQFFWVYKNMQFLYSHQTRHRMLNMKCCSLCSVALKLSRKKNGTLANDPTANTVRKNLR